ncbi:SWIM-type domain-containing protein [Abeliophyllum distichum]|uniref:SWIM-type domain-containing protein n=1 Tax=Abeliophyllum distichum TaxID=126358 RepID=A0ABD1TKU1_9LAMI
MPGLHFSDSKDDVNDGEFIFDKNALERIAVGLNSDPPPFEEAHIVVAKEGVESDESYYTSYDELHTDYSLGEENNYMFPKFIYEKELFDPKFEVGKTFKNMELFTKAVRNYRVVTQCNFRFRSNDDRRAQVVCKLSCKWKIYACKKGFKSDCIQLIGLDEYFLKGSFRGQMLSTVALDANNSIYRAIVEKDNTISWRWFVRHLGNDLGIVNNNEWTLMSDRQKVCRM